MCQKFCGNDAIHDREPAKAGSSRRQFLVTGASAFGAAAAFATPASALGSAELSDMPPDTGLAHRKFLLKGGAVLSMDPSVGDFAQGDVLVQGSKIVAVGPNLVARGATVVNAAGTIVMPGFVDTHHHQ
ncbi:hypothetical protein WMF18_16465 [Sorangium sp. So ce315]|uniref:hypothetical protein n=1 Tax=Sorangium sp. So ce315 TaxID=3133299 RepID=UPI003F62F88F